MHRLKKTGNFHERFDLKFFDSHNFWRNFYFGMQQFVERCFGPFSPFRTKCHKFIDSGNPWNQWVWACFGDFCLFSFVKFDEVFCALFSVQVYDLCRKKTMC